MSLKKSVKEVTKGSTEINDEAALATEVADPVPTQVSVPPATWTKPAKIGRKGRRPKHGLNLVAPALAAELLKNAAALREELGPKAVDPQQLAAALNDAVSWDGVDDKAETFRVYARVQRGASWDEAVALMVGLMPGIRFALKRDPTFADRFPKIAKAFAPSRRSKKAKTEATASPETPAAQEQPAAKPVTTA